MLTVREGDTLRALVDNPGVNATIIAADGSELATAGTDIAAASLPGGDVWVRVTPAGAGTVYGLSLECTATDAPTPPPSCACGATTTNDTALALAALAGVFAVRRRRRA